MHYSMIDEIPSPCFDFADIYDEAVEIFPDGSRFVEIGVYAGKSTCYMAQKIKESGKDIRFWAIDTFKYVSESMVQKIIDSLGLQDYVTLISGRSQEVVNTSFDNEFHFVFIDGSHKFDDVFEDIVRWYPKVCSGGIIGGHDYTDEKHSPDVRQAVDAYILIGTETYKTAGKGFPKLEVKGASWVIRK